MSADSRSHRRHDLVVDPDYALDATGLWQRTAGVLRHRAMAISPDEVSFDVRGFHASSPAARSMLERHGGAFVSGFNMALRAPDTNDLARRLREIPLADRGFAYEGSAMALAVLDILTPAGGQRLERLLRGPGDAHVYMLHAGAGWALARLRLRPGAHLPMLDPFLRWLAIDGYGFHQGFFDPRRYVERQHVSRRLSSYERRTFDHGLGRSLWFVDGADVERVAETIAAYPESRRADLWSGVGLAASYTTVIDEADLLRLAHRAGSYRPHLTQGAAFAVGARHRAGNLVDHTRLAADVLCDAPVEQVVLVVDEAREGLSGGSGRDYERWRARIRQALAPTAVAR